MTCELEQLQSTQLVRRWRRTKFWENVRQAMVRWRSIAWLALVTPTTLLTVATGNWAIGIWSFVTGAAVLATMVGMDVARRTPPLFPEPVKIVPHGVLAMGVLPEEIRSDEFRGRYLSILRKHEQLVSIVGEADPLTPALQGIVEGCDELVAEAGHIAREANHVEAYLEQPQVICGKQRAAELEAQAEATGDIEACTTYLRAAALAHRNDELRIEMRGALDRVSSRLSAIETLLDVMATRVVRLRSSVARGDAVAGYIGNAELLLKSDTEELDLSGLERELNLVESSVREAGVGEAALADAREGMH